MLALGMHRPTRIKDHDFDVPMLEVADMEYDLLTRRHDLLGLDHIGPFNKIKQLESAELCIQKSRLSIIINRSVQLQGAGTAEAESRAGFSSFENPINGIDELDCALQSWRKSLPQSCRYQPFSGERREVGTAPVDVRRHLLHMAYYTALYALHRPRILPDSPQSFSNTGLTRAQERSKSMVLESADNITQLAAELQNHDMDRNLPISAITVLCPALSIHLLNMKSQSQDVRNMAIVNFRVCMKTMEKLKKLYSAAEVTVNFLEFALSKIPTASLTTLTLGANPAGDTDTTDVWTVLSCALPPQTGGRITDLEDRVDGDQLMEKQQFSRRDSMLNTVFEERNDGTDDARSTETHISTLEPFLNAEFDFNAIDDFGSWAQETNPEWEAGSNVLSRTPLSLLGISGVDLNYDFALS